MNYDDISISDIRRGFMYGDGVFETMRWSNNQLLFYKSHLSRLHHSMNALKLEDGNFNDEIFSNSISLLNSHNKHSDMRLRLSIFRTGEGLYRTNSRSYSWLLEYENLSNQLYNVNKSGLKVDFSENVKLHPSSYSAYKTLNSLNYILAGIEATDRNVDDLIILNYEDLIVESVSSNVYGFSNDKLFTPQLSSGCIDGIFKGVLKEVLPGLGIELIDSKMTIENLMNCSSVYLSNVITGLQWVGQIGKINFQKGPIQDITDKVNSVLYD